MFKPVKVRQYLSLMKERGFSAEAVLAGSGVTQETLASPDFLMDLEPSRAIVANMIALTGDNGIGLEIGSQTELLDLGLVGYAMMSSQSLRQTVEHWVNFSNALIGMPMQVKLEERAPNDWALAFSESTPLGLIYRFCVEEQLTMAYKLGCDLSPTKPRLLGLELGYPPPAHHERYRLYFDCPIVFGARYTRIRFSSPRLDQPLRGDDPELNDFCARQCRMVLQHMRHHGPVTLEIVRILSQSPDGVPTIEALAGKLRTSTRTLRRHLQNEGTTYQRLLNEFRAARAKEYLRASLNAKEVSYRLGFSEANSFRRSFKLWTGQTVREYLATEHGQRGC